MKSQTAKVIVVLTTISSASKAEQLAREIIKSKLAACVQILPAMQSVYIWENEIQTESEHLLLIKTLDEKYDELERYIQANHNYEVPEIVALPVEKISESYFDWIRNSVD